MSGGGTIRPRNSKPAEAAPQSNSVFPAGFNVDAATEVYRKAGTLTNGFWAAATGNWSDAASQRYITDATIKASTIDTNLAAIKAGAPNSDMAKFADIVAAHPDLKEATGLLLKKEGLNAVTGMQRLITGNGSISMDQLSTLMNDPTKRGLIVQMMNNVAKSDKLTMNDAVEFTEDALKAAGNPLDEAARKKFMATAKRMGVDTGKLEEQAWKDLAQDFFKNPQMAVAKFMNGLDMDPQLKAVLTGVMGSLGGFFKETISYYAYGQGNQPGLVQILGNAYGNLEISGQQSLDAANGRPAAGQARVAPTAQPVQTALAGDAGNTMVADSKRAKTNFDLAALGLAPSTDGMAATAEFDRKNNRTPPAAPVFGTRALV